MSSARFDRLIKQGTDGAIRLADGHTISVITAAGADAVAVYLWPGLPAPDASGWEDEDPAEVFLTGGNMDGRYCCDVPVQAVRDLIEQHGGEAAAAADDEVITAPLAQLRATGVRCLDGRDSAGHYVRVPLADGTEITVSGTAADRDGTRGAEVSIHHPVRDHVSWQASWINRDGRSVDVYDSYGQHRPYEEDTAGLVAAVLTQVQQCGGSAPEKGVGRPPSSSPGRPLPNKASPHTGTTTQGTRGSSSVATRPAKTSPTCWPSPTSCSTSAATARRSPSTALPRPATSGPCSRATAPALSTS